MPRARRSTARPGSCAASRRSRSHPTLRHAGFVVTDATVPSDARPYVRRAACSFNTIARRGTSTNDAHSSAHGPRRTPTAEALERRTPLTGRARSSRARSSRRRRRHQGLPGRCRAPPPMTTRERPPAHTTSSLVKTAIHCAARTGGLILAAAVRSGASRRSPREREDRTADVYPTARVPFDSTSCACVPSDKIESARLGLGSGRAVVGTDRHPYVSHAEYTTLRTPITAGARGSSDSSHEIGGSVAGEDSARSMHRTLQTRGTASLSSTAAAARRRVGATRLRYEFIPGWRGTDGRTRVSHSRALRPRERTHRRRAHPRQSQPSPNGTTAHPPRAAEDAPRIRGRIRRFDSALLRSSSTRPRSACPPASL